MKMYNRVLNTQMNLLSSNHAKVSREIVMVVVHADHYE